MPLAHRYASRVGAYLELLCAEPASSASRHAFRPVRADAFSRAAALAQALAASERKHDEFSAVIAASKEAFQRRRVTDSSDVSEAGALRPNLRTTATRLCKRVRSVLGAAAEASPQARLEAAARLRVGHSASGSRPDEAMLGAPQVSPAHARPLFPRGAVPTLNREGHVLFAGVCVDCCPLAWFRLRSCRKGARDCMWFDQPPHSESSGIT